MRLRALLAAVCVILCASEQHAAAQDSADVALAEQLFQEAQVLFRQKRYDEACPRFEESQRLDPGGGTLFQLASCHALTGKTASAWAEFDEVALLAKQRGRPDIEHAAREQVRALEPELSRIVIVVSDAAKNVEGLSVRRDGTVLGPAALGTAMPVDPGAHEISAGAPGYRPWTASVVLGPGADVKTITVPGLVALPSAEPPRPPPPSTVTREVRVTKYSPALIYGALGVGVLGVGVATFFGVESYVKERDARGKCRTDPCSDATGVQASKDGVTDANVANVAAAAGIVGLGVAAYLFFTNGNASSTKSKTALQVSGSPVSPLSLGVQGRF